MAARPPRPPRLSSSSSSLAPTSSPLGATRQPGFRSPCHHGADSPAHAPSRALADSDRPHHRHLGLAPRPRRQHHLSLAQVAGRLFWTTLLCVHSLSIAPLAHSELTRAPSPASLRPLDTSSYRFRQPARPGACRSLFWCVQVLYMTVRPRAERQELTFVLPRARSSTSSASFCSGLTSGSGLPGWEPASGCAQEGLTVRPRDTDPPASACETAAPVRRASSRLRPPGSRERLDALP